MRKKFFLLTTCLCVIAALLYIYKFNAVQTITFFPIDEENAIAEADSELTFIQEENKGGYKIGWKVESKSSKPFYLRQDASLLFSDGELLGVRSKWAEDTARIQFEERLEEYKNRYFQAISYHHGEVHYAGDTIKSVHTMSHDELYVMKETGGFFSFRSPDNNRASAAKKKLEMHTQQQLLYHWNQLLAHFRIDKASYTMVPMTGLYPYKQKELPGLTQAETDKVIGQLWEGIYKNYIIPAACKKKGSTTNYMPIILFSKDQSHLLVLFELNGKKQKLIQQYS